jgi:hypothetical protein
MIRARSVKSVAMLPTTDRVLSTGAAAASAIAEASSAEKKKRGSRRRTIRKPVSFLPIVAGTVFSIALLVFMATIDFHPMRMQQRNQRRTDPYMNFTTTAKNEALPLPTLDGSVCWFDGHCPARTICASTNNGVGTCVSIDSALSQSQVADATCANACLSELQLDEHFYHESWPVLLSSHALSISSSLSSLPSNHYYNYPNGCVLTYERVPSHYQPVDDNHNEVASSVRAWTHSRFHHVKRVDAVATNNNKNAWLALCTRPCNSNSQCNSAAAKSTAAPAFVCLDGACQRNPNHWPQLEPATIVTAATGEYWRGLENLVASAQYWAPQHKVVIYNLGGFSQDQYNTMKAWPNVADIQWWPDGIPAHYPAHVHVGKIYAWKPLILNETLLKYKSIFWLDAGSTLAGPMDAMQTVLEHQGIMLVKGQDTDMRERAHAATYKYLGYDKDTMLVGPHFSGNTQAYLYPSRYYDTVVAPNADCALHKACIAPESSNLNNHRYDQTTLSLLAYQPHVRCPHYTEYLAATQPQSDLTRPSFSFVWTSRQACDFYTRLAAASKEKKGKN